MNNRIRELRKNLNLTQQEFADKLGVKRNTVGQWECGVNPITQQIMNLICKEFRVRKEWLETGEGEMYETLTGQEELALALGKCANRSEWIKAFIIAISKANEEELKAFESFANRMIEERLKRESDYQEFLEWKKKKDSDSEE